MQHNFFTVDFTYKGNATQRKRLKRFSAYLRKLKPEYFNLDTLCSVKGTTTATVNDIHVNGCGTAACALGNLPIFNRRRFRFKHYRSDFLDNKTIFDVVDNVTGTDDWCGLAKEYFGFKDSEECSSVFLDDGYIEKATPQDVADKIDVLLAVKGKS